MEKEIGGDAISATHLIATFRNYPCRRVHLLSINRGISPTQSLSLHPVFRHRVGGFLLSLLLKHPVLCPMKAPITLNHSITEDHKHLHTILSWVEVWHLVGPHL